MNDGEKILVELVLSDVNYLVSAKLLRNRSSWFHEKISQSGRNQSVALMFADAATFEWVLLFMCTGLLPISSHLENELEAVLKVAMVAHWLKMEGLEWCAAGRLGEYFQFNMSKYLPKHAIDYVLSNTRTASHLREWLADHVAGCLSTGTIHVGTIADLLAVVPNFASMIILEMQITTTAVTEALLDTDVSNIERARSEVIGWRDYETDSGNGQQGLLDVAEDEEMDEERDDSDGEHEQGESSQGNWDGETDNEMEDDSEVQDENEAGSGESAEES